MRSMIVITGAKVTALIPILAMVGLSACSKPDPTPDEQLVAQVESQIRASMKDPDSAQFRPGFADAKKQIVCGEVNAKNSYGGYTGFEKYSYYKDRFHLQSDDLKTYLLGSGYCLVTEAERGIADAKKGELPGKDKQELINMYQKNIDNIKRNPTFGA